MGRPINNWKLNVVKLRFKCLISILALGYLLVQSYTALSAPQTIQSGELTTISFESSSPLASKYEIANRLLHVGVKAELDLNNSIIKDKLSGFSIDPTEEVWSIHIPAAHSNAQATNNRAIFKEGLKPKYYGVLVWIDARERPRIPRSWLEYMEKKGLIFVAAHNSGNSQSDIDRRIPLALHAVYNLKKQYNVDNNRVYVAGLSGGARVASHLAIAYGDIFSGGYFIAGNDSISSTSTPIPDNSILANIQNNNRYVFLSGKYDTLVYAKTKKTINSFKQLCILNISQQQPRIGHGMPKASFFARAITFLDSNKTKPKETKDCQRNLLERVTIAKMKLSNIDKDSDRQKTYELMIELQQQFGNLITDDFNKIYHRLYH